MGDIEGQKVECELDTEAAITVIPERLVPQPIQKKKNLTVAGGSINGDTTEVRINIGLLN